MLEHGGQAGGVKCISIFTQRLSSPTDAISAMTAISDSETIEAGAIATLIQALSHHHPSLRNTGVETFEKLSWALITPEDWGLRYAAAVSLQEIATPEACVFLQVAQNQESDKVVRRITVGLQHLTF